MIGLVSDIRSNKADYPDNVLENAKGSFESVFIIGYDNQGFLDARSTLNLNQSQILFLLEQFKFKLLRGDYSDE